VPCSAPPRGFTDTKLPWSDVINNNPCGGKVLQRAGRVAPAAADGCQGYWRVHETQGAVAADSSGLGNDAAYIGGPTLGQPGAQGGNAVLLDGSTQWIETPVAFPTCGDVFTLMGWARMPTFKYSALFSRNGAYLVRFLSSLGFGLTVYGLGAVVSSTSVPVADGQWHHYAVAKNGATACKLFFDGADVSGAVTNQTCGAGSASGVRIGSSHNGAPSVEAMPGLIDEPMIFNTYLSAARIAEFAKGKDTSADGLCSFHYQMKYGGAAVSTPITVEP
jgi:Concanavalin A-like lectin/glucanases superfamily